MYAFKQFVGVLATPLLFALLIAVAAAALHALRWRGLSRWLLAFAAAIVWLGALPGIGDALLSPLERRHPPFDAERWHGAVTHVVVLGSSYTPRTGYPITAALDDEGLARAVEAIVLFRRLGATRLVVSGGAPMGSSAPAAGYAALARSLGVPEASMIVLDQSLDTDDEARTVMTLLGTSPFILVTSAYHMPRAVGLMEHAGAHPIPAPVAQRVLPQPTQGVRRWLPSSRGLRRTELAMHEYLGLLAIRLGIDD